MFKKPEGPLHQAYATFKASQWRVSLPFLLVMCGTSLSLSLQTSKLLLWPVSYLLIVCLCLAPNVWYFVLSCMAVASKSISFVARRLNVWYPYYVYVDIAVTVVTWLIPSCCLLVLALMCYILLCSCRLRSGEKSTSFTVCTVWYIIMFLETSQWQLWSDSHPVIVYFCLVVDVRCFRAFFQASLQTSLRLRCTILQVSTVGQSPLLFNPLMCGTSLWSSIPHSVSCILTGNAVMFVSV